MLASFDCLSIVDRRGAVLRSRSTVLQQRTTETTAILCGLLSLPCNRT